MYHPNFKIVRGKKNMIARLIGCPMVANRQVARAVLVEDEMLVLFPQP